MNIAPIILFVYNQSNTTIKVLSNLKKNYLAKVSELYIFSDGPKNNKKDKRKVLKVREHINTVKGFKKVHIIKRKKNFGLYKNITSGLDLIFSKKKSAIILEDDILVSKNFLDYMNKSLDLYKNYTQVGSICGTSSGNENKLPDTFFLYHQDCWGWATWKSSWKLYTHNSSYLLKKIKKKGLSKKFNLDDKFFFTRYLEENIIKRKSWATNWYASLFINDKLNLFPGYSMCKNIGFTPEATNSKIFFTTSDLSTKKIKIKKIDFKESKIGYEEIVNFYSKVNREVRFNYYKMNISKRIKKFLNKLI